MKLIRGKHIITANITQDEYNKYTKEIPRDPHISTL